MSLTGSAGLLSLLLLTGQETVATATPAPASSTVQEPSPGPSTPGLTARVPRERFAELTFSNRHIMTFRAVVVPREPADRAESARRTLADLADANIRGPVSSRPLLGATVITVAGRDVFGVIPADLDDTEEMSVVTREIIGRLEIALAEAAELRTPRRLLRGAGATVVASLLLGLILVVLTRLRRWTTGRLMVATSSHLRRSQLGFDLAFLRASRLLDLACGSIKLAAWLITTVCAYAWLSFVLQQFPLTRPWGEALGGFLVATMVSLGLGALSAMPGLFTASLIFLVSRFLVRLFGLLFTAVEQGRLELFGLDAPKAAPTRRLVAVLIWIFAIVVAYPYLPGSNTDAFKGVSVFVGLVVSLGSSGIVSHVMSGFMLTYSGALAPGDYARIGDVEGVVTGLGVLSTKVKTRRNEEVTIPNAVVISGNTVNYSRYQDEGVYFSTAVTIGYDSPWRVVEAMLIDAARRTPGLRPDCAPAVVQTSLSDFYVEYTLVICPQHPARRVPVLAALHANIQDVFNERGIQIMSPHYEADPPNPKMVPRDRWNGESDRAGAGQPPPSMEPSGSADLSPSR